MNRYEFYREHKEFIDDCMSYLKNVELLHEVDAERICYELAFRNGR